MNLDEVASKFPRLRFLQLDMEYVRVHPRSLARIYPLADDSLASPSEGQAVHQQASHHIHHPPPQARLRLRLRLRPLRPPPRHHQGPGHTTTVALHARAIVRAPADTRGRHDRRRRVARVPEQDGAAGAPRVGRLRGAHRVPAHDHPVRLRCAERGRDAPGAEAGHGDAGGRVEVRVRWEGRRVGPCRCLLPRGPGGGGCSDRVEARSSGLTRSGFGVEAMEVRT